MGLREKKSFCSVENEFVKIISKLLLQIHVKHVGATKFALLSARLLTNNFNKQNKTKTQQYSTFLNAELKTGSETLPKKHISLLKRYKYINFQENQ